MGNDEGVAVGVAGGKGMPGGGLRMVGGAEDGASRWRRRGTLGLGMKAE